MNWLLKRIGTPEWAARELERYAEFYGKEMTEAIREATVDKALNIREEMGGDESDTSQSVPHDQQTRQGDS